MGSNNGTGQPYWFRCSKCRRFSSGSLRGGYDVLLTGRKRPHRGKVGARITHIDRQYVCLDCGHYGWSAHVELSHTAGDHPYLMMKDGKLYLPSYARFP